MAAAVNVVQKGKAYFPDPIIEVITPDKKFLEGLSGYVQDLSQQDINALVASAKLDGFDRGALVLRSEAHYISADVYNWGIVTGMNYQRPTGSVGYPGPVEVTWPFKHGTEKKVTKHFTSELFLIDEAPTEAETKALTESFREWELERRSKK